MKKQLFKTINELLTALEAARSFEDLTAEEAELYKTLSFCSDLLAATEANQSAAVEVDGNLTTPLPATTNALANFVHHILTGTPGLNMRQVLRQQIPRGMQGTIAQRAEIRPASLSDYFAQKSDCRTNTFTKLLEASFPDKEK